MPGSFELKLLLGSTVVRTFVLIKQIHLFDTVIWYSSSCLGGDNLCNPTKTAELFQFAGFSQAVNTPWAEHIVQIQSANLFSVRVNSLAMLRAFMMLCQVNLT